MKLKSYDKWIQKKEIIKTDKTITKEVRKAKLRVAWEGLRYKLDFMKDMPITLMFFIFTFIMIITLAFLNHQRFIYWSTQVQNAYPEIAKNVYDANGQLIQVSPLDRLMVDFISRTQAYYFLLFFIFLGLSLKNIWGYIGTPKHQHLSRR